MVAPYDITLKRNKDDINIVQPDIMVICDLAEKLGDDGYYKGVPTLVVEILSESTCKKDLTNKLDLYMCCGIEEYWVVNPLNCEVAVYQLSGLTTQYRSEEHTSELQSRPHLVCRLLL